MQITGTKSYIEETKSSLRTRRAQKKEAPAEVRTTPDYPLVLTHPSGLRGMEQTQDLDGLEAKGLIIDRYL